MGINMNSGVPVGDSVNPRDGHGVMRTAGERDGVRVPVDVDVGHRDIRNSGVPVNEIEVDAVRERVTDREADRERLTDGDTDTLTEVDGDVDIDGDSDDDADTLTEVDGDVDGDCVPEDDSDTDTDTDVDKEGVVVGDGD